jgi:hypothetical protein
MDCLQYPFALKLDKVVVRGALGWKILGQLPPLATRGQHVENAVEERAAGHAALRWQKRLYQCILLIGQIALIAQTLALVASAVLGRPHGRPRRIDAHGGTESQPIPRTQENSGRALRGAGPLNPTWAVDRCSTSGNTFGWIGGLLGPPVAIDGPKP